MGQVYSNAVCTLKADSAKSCMESFLRMRDDLWREAVPIHINRYGTESQIFVRLLPYVEACPTDARGWILQETLLSKRLIGFTHSQVVFSCGGGRITEDGDLREESRWLIEEAREVWLRIEPENAAWLWRSIVVDYSYRKLSRVEDKLAAIAGLASAHKIRNLSADQYLGGLWRSSFIQDLIWRPETNENLTHLDKVQPPLVGYPSWSWSRVDGPINYPQNETYEVLDGYTSLVGVRFCRQDEAEFDPRPSIEVTLEGPSVAIELYSSPTEKTLHWKPVSATWKKNYNSLTLDFPVEAVKMSSDKSQITLVPSLRHTDNELHGLRVKAHFILLCTDCELAPHAYFLLLVPSSVDETKYVRIGLYYDFFGFLATARSTRRAKQAKLKRLESWLTQRMEKRSFVVI
ncbi:hypothetical protein H2200_004507 [Cladophialophora chaetospira]|uniref:Heterokaryon incompatibility domain-containing protein n=1 Tax=Cladophialophora chaetospira TaxID=386627 RepID=A0AA38XD85_9EURO|nr:hypothetical protein H2200_004507 [Cladophialophora chaetospira]